MIKTLIVDDDFLVRMYLKQVIDWEAKGYLLIGDASNGKEALAVLRAERPDLLITDLSMPVMDGIALIRQARSEFPHLGIVALSCHDEFDYVKEAMKCGADEYILKNLLDEALLCSTLEMVGSKIGQSVAQNEEQETLSLFVRKGVELVRQELQETLCQQKYTMAEQRRLCQEAGIDGDFQRCAVLLVGSEIKDSALRPVLEEYCKGKQAFCLGTKEDRHSILLDLSKLPSHAVQWERTCSFAEGLKQCVTDYLNLAVVIAVSNICAGDGSLFSGLSQAADVWTYSVYGPGIYRHGQLPSASDLPAEAKALRDRIKDGISAEHAAVKEMSPAAFSALRIYRVSPDVLHDWYGSLMAAGEIKGALPATLTEMERQWTQTINGWIEREAVGPVPTTAGEYHNPAVQQAADFVRRHFQEPITLSQVAEEVHLNAAYLSYLFKQQTRVNFSDYLTNCRLAQVKKLLRETDDSIKDCVAAAGFSDYRNFCKLFKKTTGMRPAEYRNLKKYHDNQKNTLE